MAIAPNSVASSSLFPRLARSLRLVRPHEEPSAAKNLKTRSNLYAVPWAHRNASPVIVTQALFGTNVAVFVGMALAGISITIPLAGT